MGTAVATLEPIDVDEDGTSASSLHSGLTYARLISLIQKHGVTGLIFVLLAYQFGWIGSSQAYMCGL